VRTWITHLTLTERFVSPQYHSHHHKVADFSKWKPAYDAHLPARQKAGLKEAHLLRNTNDPNEVILLFEAADLQKAKEFAGSSDLRETMQNAGVIDKPDIYFLE
jgi:hypothetical protein